MTGSRLRLDPNGGTTDTCVTPSPMENTKGSGDARVGVSLRTWATVPRVWLGCVGADLGPPVCPQCSKDTHHSGAEQHPLPGQRNGIHALVGCPEQSELLQPHVGPHGGLWPHEGMSC